MWILQLFDDDGASFFVGPFDKYMTALDYTKSKNLNNFHIRFVDPPE